MNRYNVGDLIKYCWEDFDGSGSEICVVVEVNEIRVLASPLSDLVYLRNRDKDKLSPLFPSVFWIAESDNHSKVEIKEA